MIKLRLLSTALLFNDRNELLMMKRAANRTLSPGQWGAIGGHMEPYEIASPMDTCLREIEEETGIGATEIEGLQLRYVLIRLFQSEIRQQFFYVGHTNAEPSIETDEGELFWVPKQDVLSTSRDLPLVFRSLLSHFYEHEECAHPWIGVAGRTTDLNEACIIWNPLIDPQF